MTRCLSVSKSSSAASCRLVRLPKTSADGRLSGEFARVAVMLKPPAIEKTSARHCLDSYKWPTKALDLS